jgi:iron complex transport system substrate-binding protein
MRRRAALLVALVVAGATACGTDDDDGAGAPTAPTDVTTTLAVAAPSTAATTAPATEPAAAERIIPVNGDLAEVVYALGLGDQVVATDISATYPAEAQDTPKIGYQRALVAETILSFEPTVILADDNAGPPEVLEQVRSAGVRVVDLPHQSTLDSVAVKIRAVAEALAVPDRGAELVTTFEDELAAATTRADTAVATSGRPKVLALYLRGTNVQLVFGEGSGIDAVIAAAGGTDLGTEMGVVDNAELSTEAIVAAAPEILLVTTTGLESVGGVDGLLAIPGIDQTPAAADRRVVAFEDQYLYGLGPRTGQLVGELVDAFHPAP